MKKLALLVAALVVILLVAGFALRGRLFDQQAAAESAPGSGPPAPASTGSHPGRAFPIGVWLQDPTFNARQYKNMGVNTFVGLWKFPSEEGTTPGWAQASLDALARNHMTAVAGETPDAVRGILALHRNQRITAWLAGDEPDMSDFGPDQWKQKIDSMLAVQKRAVYGNFGKSFGGFDWWYDHMTDAERAAYCAPLDIASVDYYGMTDHTEDPDHRGPWTYGRAVDNLQKACGPSKPTYAFVETTQPSNESANAATPQGMRAAAWNAIIHGADGIEWFVHDFYCPDGCGDKVFATDPQWAANRRAVARLDAEIHRYDAALTGPDVDGVTTSTGIPLALLTKQVGDTTYVFAQADGDSSHPDGYTGRATVTVRGHSFTDSWAPYQVRVYTVPSSG